MRIYIKKLGCPKNDVDADYLAAGLIDARHNLVENDFEAEVVIVNTCGFILPAQEESINEILKYEELKNSGQIDRLYVTGCMTQRFVNELRNELELVDGYFGLGKMAELIRALNNPTEQSPVIYVEDSRQLTFLAGDKRYVNKKYPYEYLKIAEGCDRYCSYCAIPNIRGRYRSRSQGDITREARFLAENGKRELILVSQEGTGYGKDKGGEWDIIDLLNDLERIEGVDWIRLMYLHPESLSNDLIKFMTDSEKVLGYFDMPLQHISDRVLKRMNRPIDKKTIINKLELIRRLSDENIIRTTFIAGFPGESDKDFDELHDFIEEFRFDRLGVFQYSPEEGTAAYLFENQIPEDIASERQDLLMSLQQSIAFEKNIALIDKTQQVIIDGVGSDGRALGRTKGDCPEIDQTVFVDGSINNVGDIIEARIIMAEGYDLIARPESRI